MKTLEQQIKNRQRFDLRDPLGRGRIRNLVYEYDALRNLKNKEIARLKDVVTNQAEAVTCMVVRANELEKENQMLRRCVKEGDEARKSLAKKLAMAESEISVLKNKYGTKEAS